MHHLLPWTDRAGHFLRTADVSPYKKISGLISEEKDPAQVHEGLKCVLSLCP